MPFRPWVFCGDRRRGRRLVGILWGDQSPGHGSMINGNTLGPGLPPPPGPASGGRTHPSRRNHHPRAGKPAMRKNANGKRALSDQPPGDLQELDRAVSYGESWSPPPRNGSPPRLARSCAGKQPRSRPGSVAAPPTGTLALPPLQRAQTHPPRQIQRRPRPRSVTSAALCDVCA